MGRKCPYCGSEELGFINICGLTFSVSCKDCGMAGPVQHTEEEAVKAFDSLCAKMCSHCISRTWGRKLRDKLKNMT